MAETMNCCGRCDDRNLFPFVEEEPCQTSKGKKSQLLHLDKEEDFFSRWVSYLKEVRKTSITLLLSPGTCSGGQNLSDPHVCATCRGWCNYLLKQH